MKKLLRLVVVLPLMFVGMCIALIEFVFDEELDL